MNVWKPALKNYPAISTNSPTAIAGKKKVPGSEMVEN
jgi:hypothetical protein